MYRPSGINHLIYELTDGELSIFVSVYGVFSSHWKGEKEKNQLQRKLAHASLIIITFIIRLHSDALVNIE